MLQRWWYAFCILHIAITNLQLCRYGNMQLCRCEYMQYLQCLMWKYAYTWFWNYANMQLCSYGKRHYFVMKLCGKWCANSRYPKNKKWNCYEVKYQVIMIYFSIWHLKKKIHMIFLLNIFNPTISLNNSLGLCGW